MKSRKRTFTLIEVIVSLAILTMGLMVSLNITANSASRSTRSDQRWRHQHMLAQAAEFYLLAGPQAPLPESVVPYDGYTVACEVVEPELGDQDTPAEIGNWRLACLKITLTDSRGKVVETLNIEKILHRDDL